MFGDEPPRAPVEPNEPICREELPEVQELMQKADQIAATEPEQAIALYEKAAKLSPSNARVQYRLGQLYKKQDEWPKAMASFTRATAIAPTFANYWFELGYALGRLAERKKAPWGDAQKALEQCIALDENLADCHWALHKVYLYQDEEKKALASLTAAIRHDPTKISRYATLADHYLRLGFSNEAEAVLREAKKFARPADKSLFGVHVLLAEIAQERGLTVDMITELEAAKAVASGEGLEAISILFSLGSAYAMAAPPRKAEAIANLTAFRARACTEEKRKIFPTECVMTETLIKKLGEAKP